jgi:hypothetical protein
MDNLSFFTVLLLIAGGVIVALASIKVGFIIPAKFVLPDLAVNPPAVEPASLPEDLPAPLLRYYRRAFGERVPAPRSVVAYGRGFFRVRKISFLGYLWSPLAWTMYLAPGESFLWKMHMTWFRRVVMQGGDGYLGGKGLFNMSRGTTIQGDTMDHSEQVMLWLLTIAFAPGVLLERPGLRWEAIDDHTARLQVEQAGRSLSFDLSFDPASGDLLRIETQRPGSREGKLYPYSLVLEGPQDFEGMKLPARLQAAWEDDAYTRYEMAGIQYNAPVRDALQEAEESYQ